MKILIVLILITFKLNAYVDLGQYGALNEIEEESFIEVLNRQAELVDKERLKNEIVSSVEESLIIKNEISTCSETRRRTITPTITAEIDIVDPATKRIIVKKGTKKNLFKDFNAVMNRHILFINADDEIQVAMARKFYKDVDVYVVKGNAFQLLREKVNVKAIPYQKMIDVMQLNCVPSFYTQDRETIVVDEINTDELIN